MMKQMMTVIALASFPLIAGVGCGTTTQPDVTQTTKDLLIDIAEDSADQTLRASADFTGDDAYLTYLLDGQPVSRALSGRATADFSLIGDEFYLTAFTTDVDPFAFEVAPLPETTISVNASDTHVQLAAIDANGMATPAPLITLVDAGANQLDASVNPVLVGNATLSAFGTSGQYTRTEQLVDPVVAHLTIAETEVHVELDYTYTISMSTPIPADATLVVHLTSTVPRPSVPL